MKGSFLHPFLWNSDGFLSEEYLEHHFADAELKALKEVVSRQSLGSLVEAFGAKRELMQGADSERVRQEWCDAVLFPLLGAEVRSGVEIVAEGRVIGASGALMRKSGAGKRRVCYRGRKAGRHIACLYWMAPWAEPLDRVVADPDDRGLTLVDTAHWALSQTGVPWAVATNGTRLRLLSRSTSHKPRCWLEVDLEVMAERAGEREAQRAYRFFLGLFSAVAFLEPDERGETRLERVVRGSARCVGALERELRVNVREALSELGRGFLVHLRNHPKATASWRAAFISSSAEAGFLESPDLLAVVHEESIEFLYRLLSLFYAESRHWAGCDDGPGGGGGLQGLCDRLAAGLAGWKSGGKGGGSGRGLWDQVQRHFRTAHEAWQGDFLVPDTGVRGVKRRSLRRRLRIGDGHLARVLDLLSHLRDPSESASGEACRRIHYRDLDVRHLGGIYEGILQYAPRIADRDLVLVRHRFGGRARERWVPLAQLNAGHKRPLERRRGAVKAPDRPRGLNGGVSGEVRQGGYYLVHAGEESLRRASGSFYTPESIVQFMVESTLGPLVRGEHRVGRRRFIPLESEEILGLKFLDPSMGSGHFLVAATEYLARAYGQALVREGRVPDGFVSDAAFTGWKRRVAERCIYGVDIDPRAVALAKLILGLFTMKPGCPMVFLDSHLKCGNALASVWPEDPERAAVADRRGGRAQRGDDPAGFQGGVAKAFSARVARVMERLRRIEARPTLSRGDLRAKRALHYTIERIRQALGPMVAQWLAATGDPVAEICAERVSVAGGAAVRGAERAPGGRGFHWPLEFPELWFDNRGARLAEPGFWAVAGNPPYFEVRRDGDESDSDTYLRFCWLACRRLSRRSASWCSMIVPDAFLNRGNAERVRRSLLDAYPVSSLVHIDRVFSEATVANLVFVAAAGGKRSRWRVARVPDGGRPDCLRDAEWRVCDPRFFAAQPRCEFLYLVHKEDMRPLRRMFGGLALGRPKEPFRALADWLAAPDHLFRGEEIGKATVREWARAGGMPFLVGGESVQPFAVRDAGLRVPVSVLGKPVARYRSPKILVQKSAARLVAAYDVAGTWGFPQSVYGILLDRAAGYYLCALLNSEALNRFLWMTATGYKLVQPQIEIEDLRRLPIYSPGVETIDLARGRELLKLGKCPRSSLPSGIAALGEELHRVGETERRRELTVRLNDWVSSVYGW